MTGGITAIAKALALSGLLAVFVGLSAGLLALAAWGLDAANVDREISLGALLVLGLAFLLIVLTGMVAVFQSLGLSSTNAALGLPEGSVRAVIALTLILIFVIMAVYLNEKVFTATDPSDQAVTVATQLLATVGTLVVAVAGFYFGTGAVTTAAAAVAAVQEKKGPMAITKGTTPPTPDENGIEKREIVGNVNPNGIETSVYFEYGTSTYGHTTKISSVGAGTAEVEVKSEPVEGLDPDCHYRVVAFNAAGTSYGKDAVVDPAPPVEDPNAPVVDPNAPVEDPNAPVEDPAGENADPDKADSESKD